MSLSFSSSVSGIHAALQVLNVSAHNVANMNTDGFKKQHANLSEGNHGRVTVNITEGADPGPLYQHANGAIVEASNVDMNEEILRQISAKHLFSANAVTLKTSAETQKGLIDLLA
ncbi:conserved hypothetical protein [Candidatus Brocadia pituitae]|nr:conserved hypothetical protein [Candidatus Brocadia pituitae]